MKNIILFLSFALLFSVTQSQNVGYPEGFYMSFKEIIEKSPSENYNIELEKRTQGKIKMNGGNDYQLNPNDKSLKKNFLKKEPFAYSNGTNLFINGWRYGLQFWYTKVESENSSYLVFKAGMPTSKSIKGVDHTNNADLTSMFGGIISGIGAAQRALIRLPYLMHKENQEVTLISKKNIAEFIGNSSKLMEKFKNEPFKDDVEIIFKYLLEWSKN